MGDPKCHTNAFVAPLTEVLNDSIQQGQGLRDEGGMHQIHKPIDR